MITESMTAREILDRLHQVTGARGDRSSTAQQWAETFDREAELYTAAARLMRAAVRVSEQLAELVELARWACDDAALRARSEARTWRDYAAQDASRAARHSGEGVAGR